MTPEDPNVSFTPAVPDAAATTPARLQKPADTESLEASIRTLRHLFNLVVLILILLSASLFIFMLRQVGAVRRQTSELSQYVGEYAKNNAPAVEEFRRKLEEFARANPDFRPIYIRYFGTNSPSPRVGPASQPPPRPGSNTADGGQ